MPNDDKEWEEEELEKAGREYIANNFMDAKEVAESVISVASKILLRLRKVSPTLRSHYIGEILAISKDLAHDLDLEIKTNEELVTLILILLGEGDDDDGSEEEPKVPKLGDLVMS